MDPSRYFHPVLRKTKCKQTEKEFGFFRKWTRNTFLVKIEAVFNWNRMLCRTSLITFCRGSDVTDRWCKLRCNEHLNKAMECMSQKIIELSVFLLRTSLLNILIACKRVCILMIALSVHLVRHLLDKMSQLKSTAMLKSLPITRIYISLIIIIQEDFHNIFIKWSYIYLKITIQ